MSQWVNRTVLTGSSADQNGTTSHTCTFTPAAAGNLLVAIVGGAVTSTTPSGWTLVTSAINNCGLYVFTKTATLGESSFSTTHNGSDYAIQGIIYEFFAGSSCIGSNSSSSISSGSQTGPQVTSLSGTYTRFAARTMCISSPTAAASTSWTTPTIEDYDVLTPKTNTDGVYLTVAYDDSQIGSSFNPSANVTSNTGTTLEAIAFALSVIPPAARLETLTDNFNDNTMDINLWSLLVGTGTSAETGGQLVLTPASNNPGSTYDGYSSVNRYDLTSSQATIELAQGVTATSGCEQAFTLEIDSSNAITMLLGGSNNLIFRLKTAGSNNDTSVTRNDTTMHWWRIRESGGTVYWETSQNGNTWTVRRSTTVSFPVTSVRLKISAGTWQNVASPGVGIYDNLNTLNTAAAPWIGF